MGFVILLVIAYAPMFYSINKRLRKLEDENQPLIHQRLKKLEEENQALKMELEFMKNKD
ncbi:hypothetical protein [Anaerobacillus alkaliphilus]|uniref:hypothetical protein n=1 Tax=Anaerobacillus alkaliphilus TaxID=1548597 RepID=UPI001375F280|nr:hypothetical protein [Anaerobacillus alkaliphilus]